MLYFRNSAFVKVKIVCLLAATVSLSLYASNKKIHFVTEHLPPYQYEIDGRITGTTTEKVKNIVTCSGLDADYSLLPFKRAYHQAKTVPNTAIYSIAKTHQRLTDFIWVGKILSIEQNIYKLSSRKDIQISKVEDLSHYRMGIQRDDFSIHTLKNDFKIPESNLVYISSNDSQEKMLINDRFDLMICGKDNLFSNLEKLKVSPDSVELVYHVGDFELYLAINKNTDGKIVQRLKKCITKP